MSLQHSNLLRVYFPLKKKNTTTHKYKRELSNDDSALGKSFSVWL